MRRWRFHNFRMLIKMSIALCGVAEVSGVALIHAADITPYQQRARLLAQMAMWTEWPKQAFADEKAPFVLGIFGKDPFGKDIDILKGTTIKNHKLVVKYCSKVEEVAGCHIVFISSSEKGRLAEVIKIAEISNVLTVAEMEEFVERNGMMNFVEEKTRPGYANLRYEINQAAAEKAKLRIHSRVLDLARNKN
jgi:hypothetical protein